MRPEIQSVNLDVTTHCDRRCPDCCCGIGINRKLQHHTWEYFERAAKALYGIPRVNLCGGEPTFHPQFAEFLPRFKELFGCQRLTMVTDGWGFERYHDLIVQHLDAVEFSDYHQPARRHSFGLHIAGLVQVSVFDTGEGYGNFTPRARRGNGQPCDRAWWRGLGVAYADGLIYGCCVAPGVNGSIGIEAEPGWDERLPPLPCGDCWFSE